MARPAKSVKTATRKLAKQEIEERINAENRIKGDVDFLVPPDYLTLDQVAIFDFILEQLKSADILGNLDAFILAQTAVSIDRVRYIEGKINDNHDLLFDSKFMASKDKYTKDFFRCCNELSLSPQSRAKLAGMFVQNKTEDPLIAALRDDDDD